MLDGLRAIFEIEEQLITREVTPRGNRRNRQWLRHWLGVLCDEAEIPRVCVHSLRGLHATLATEAGVSSHAVASALGHTSAVVTHAHYVQPGTQKRMSSRRVVEKLGERSPTGALHRSASESGNEIGSVRFPDARKRRSPLLPRGEERRAIGGTRTPTVLPTGT